MDHFKNFLLKGKTEYIIAFASKSAQPYFSAKGFAPLDEVIKKELKLFYPDIIEEILEKYKRWENGNLYVSVFI